MLIKVTNLGEGTSRDDIFLLFEEFGEVQDVRLIRSFKTRNGYVEALVEMTDRFDAAEAVELLNGERFDGKWIEVKFENDQLESNYEDSDSWQGEEDWDISDDSIEFFDDNSF